MSEHKKRVLYCFIAILIAFLAFALAEVAQETADINNVFEIVVNNTNLAPAVIDHPGTGERISGVMYFTNTSPIELLVFAHANSVSQTATVEVNINGTIVSNQSGRPLGTAENAYRSVDLIIPKGSTYIVNFSNFHHYEWREYPILSGKNGTLSLNQTFITQGTSFNATYASQIAAIQANDSYFNSTLLNKVNKSNAQQILSGTELRTFGNSITACFSVTTAQCYVTLVANAGNYSLTNTAVSGDMAADIADSVYATRPNNSNQQYVIDIGSNDARLYGSNNSNMTGFRDALQAEVAWLAIPNSSKVFGNSSNVTYTGTWSNTQAYRLGNNSHTVGDTATFYVYGSTIYIGTIAQDGNLGQFNITVDSSTVYGNYNNTWVGGLINTINGRTYAPKLIRIAGLNDTNHTVKITVVTGGGSNNVYLDWAAGTGVYEKLNHSDVYVGNVPRQSAAGYAANGGSDTITASYNAQIKELTNELAFDGLSVHYVDIASVLNDNTDIPDGIHPDAVGHQKMANEFITAMDKLNVIRESVPVSMSSFVDVYPISSLIIPGGGFVKIPFNGVITDNHVDFNSNTNSFVVPQNGIYTISLTVKFSEGNSRHVISIYKNDVEYKRLGDTYSSGSNYVLSGTTTVRLNQTDRISAYAFAAVASGVDPGNLNTSMTIVFLR